MRRSSNRRVLIEDEGSSSIAERNYTFGGSFLLRASRVSLIATFNQEIMQDLERRDRIKVFDIVDGEEVEVTPRTLNLILRSEYLRKLKDEVKGHPLLSESHQRLRVGSGSFSGSQSRVRSSARMVIGGLRLSMEDVVDGIGSSKIRFDRFDSETDVYTTDETVYGYPDFSRPFVKIQLHATDFEILFEQKSITAMKHTREGDRVETDNKIYDYLTYGKGRVRRRVDAETQTYAPLVKSRETNTPLLNFKTISTFVSNFEMYDTFRFYRKSRKARRRAERKRIKAMFRLPCTKLSVPRQMLKIFKSAKFKTACMITKRCLAANEFAINQRFYRNLDRPDRYAMDLYYRYSINILFRFLPQPIDKKRIAVADLSFCPRNGDIVAAAYGIYSYSAMTVPKNGYVCVWNIKNPGDPERCYYFNAPAVSVEFSPFTPTLIAIGLYDGNVHVYDISQINSPPVAISQRKTSPSCEPIIAIRWIKQNETLDSAELDPFLTLSQNGLITRFRIINSPYLLAYQQMTLERIEGIAEGLPIKTNTLTLMSNRHPQGINMTIHPYTPDLYYILTDEGTILKCSTNYRHQYLEVMKAHDGAISTMDFSPWSPKLFLTCGSDWVIRLWMDGVFRPILELFSEMTPIHAAYWSRTHSTVIMALTRKTFDIWDIRRTILGPVSSNPLDSSFNTLYKYASCGRCIAVGNERGNVLMCTLDEMPFPPHYQYDELDRALFKWIRNLPDLVSEVRSIGYYGYPKKAKYSGPQY